MPKNFWLKPEANKQRAKTGENLLKLLKLILKKGGGKKFDLINWGQKRGPVDCFVNTVINIRCPQITQQYSLKNC